MTNGLRHGGSASSPTRGVFAGGVKEHHLVYNQMDFCNNQTTGNAVDFGDLTAGRDGKCLMELFPTVTEVYNHVKT